MTLQALHSANLRFWATAGLIALAAGCVPTQVVPDRPLNTAADAHPFVRNNEPVADTIAAQASTDQVGVVRKDRTKKAEPAPETPLVPPPPAPPPPPTTAAVPQDPNASE
jgi:hypothetical protein